MTIQQSNDVAGGEPAAAGSDRVLTIPTPGLGNSTFVLEVERVAIVIDPQRDIDRFLREVDSLGAEVRWVLETHIHNDYVSGGRHISEATGAELVLPAASGAAFRHTPAFHGEEMAEGPVRIRPIHTPGHTPEHMSYLVLVDDEPVALFSGGSLLNGGAGRSDLLGQARAKQLARLQFQSIVRLSQLPDALAVYPTHGGGSYCSAQPTGTGATTIGVEKRINPALLALDGERFARSQLETLEPYPTYFANMGLINVEGSTGPLDTSVPVLDPDQAVDTLFDAVFVDARPHSDYSAGHIPCSIGIELRIDFASWVGWLVPFNEPIVLILNPDQDWEDAIVQMGRIGYDNVVGILPGLEQWNDLEYAMEEHEIASILDFATGDALGHSDRILDVRSRTEWDAGHIPGSVHQPVHELLAGLPSALDTSGQVWIICETGFRAHMAAGLLERMGVESRVVAPGGVGDIMRFWTSTGPGAPALS